jgi:hypothetical protein
VCFARQYEKMNAMKRAANEFYMMPALGMSRLSRHFRARKFSRVARKCALLSGGAY